MFKARITSSLEKAFADDRIENYPELKRISALKGERVSVQLVYSYVKGEDEPSIWAIKGEVKMSGELAEYASIRKVDHIPVTMPCSAAGEDDNMLRIKPGIFPDVLSELNYGGKLPISRDTLFSAWIEINLPKEIEAGVKPFTVSVDFGKFNAECTVDVEIINATLPDEDIYFTQWFHTDCIAQYYEIPVFSEKYWTAVENFARVAVRNGINTLLTPVFTPPLDTAVGGERLTVQLVGVTLDDGKYTFDFTLLDKWIDMCNRVGVKNLEISHLFTQWGAAHAPKIIATVKGEYKKIFGWETEATGEEYSTFIRQFLKELVAHLKARGDDKRCIYHISDEPSLEHFENYKSAKAVVADLLDGYMIVDALSNIDFYKTGVLDHPVPASNHITDFLNENIEGLWTYYCVSQWDGVSNRYHSMPAWRNRSIGMQMYKYNIAGFLHWGYNFYNNQYSDSATNPYLEHQAEHAFVSGDSHSVYPGPNGTCLESMRIKVFFEALQDIKAMKLCESLYSHDEVVKAMEDIYGEEIKFSQCVKSAATMLAIREKINEMIKARI